MTLKNYKLFLESQSQSELDQFFSDCDLFINDLKKCEKNTLLYRGIYSDSDRDIQYYDHIMYRVPTDTPRKVHDVLNDLFEDRFGWKVRNGVFCFKHTDDMFEDKYEYGDTTYYLFPVGKYKLCYNKKVEDLFPEIEHIIIKHASIEDYKKEYGPDKKGRWIGTFWEPDINYFRYTRIKFSEMVEENPKILQSLVDGYEEKSKIYEVNIPKNTEISVKCDGYYLISLDLRKKLIDYIWG